tara:strand:+ start:328 stop:882 length:555 start_codon:yes stop_codon:yes gene_type:complete
MIPLPNKKYNIIYADPPYPFTGDKYQDGNRGFGNKVEDRYETMSIKKISDIPVKKITNDDALLFMWVTDSHLNKSFEIIDAWGFKFATIGFVWVKQTKNKKFYYNLGKYTMKSTELCLIGLKGKLKNIKKSNNVKSLLLADRTIHSKKPNEIRNRIISLCGDIPRIELFARQKTEGWDCWGNEI